MGKGNDLVMNLLLKTGGFSNDIKTAKREIQDFKNNASNAGKSVEGFSSSLGINIGVLGKLGSAIGIATSAGAAFKKIIDNSQTTADKYAVIMGSASTVIDNFASALARVDFTAFNQGLDDM